MGAQLTVIDPGAQRRQEVVDKALDLVRRCESGEYVDFAYVAQTKDAGVKTDWTSTNDQPGRIAAVTCFLWSLCSHAEKNAE